MRLFRGRFVTKLFYLRRKELALGWMIKFRRESGLTMMDCAHLAVQKFNLLQVRR